MFTEASDLKCLQTLRKPTQVREQSTEYNKKQINEHLKLDQMSVQPGLQHSCPGKCVKNSIRRHNTSLRHSSSCQLLSAHGLPEPNQVLFIFHPRFVDSS